MDWIERYISKFGDTLDVEPEEYVNSTDPSDELIGVHEAWGDRCVIRYELVKEKLGGLETCITDVFDKEDVICSSLRELRERLGDAYGESYGNSVYGDLVDAELSFITGNMKASLFRTVLGNLSERLK